ncbi:MAG: J domain-containing protein [Bdellovibrionales bacterium]|nr:J domain-containing protein [Bdellovibrionales bacterium]
MLWAYHTLGCVPGAPKEKVKKNYRRLLMAYHPDRLLHSKLSDDQKRRDLQKFYEVQKAWEALEQVYQTAEQKVA